MEKKLLDLTAPQKSIWLTEQFYFNTNINNICATVIADQILDLNILSKSINLVIQNSDIFKIHFIKKNGELKQYFENIENKNFDIIELNSKDEISTLEQSLLSRVFNINEELFEIKIFKIKNLDICGCIINIHHIIADAFSIGILCQKVMNTYNKLINNLPIENNNNFSYENYIKTEQEYFTSKKFENDKKYWEEKFSSMPNIVSVPSTKAINANSFSFKANRFNYQISKNKMETIKNFCNNNKISIFNLFMGILSVYLHKVNNSNDFIIGTPILNRSNFYDKNTLGMYINIAPLRININNEDTITTLLSTISKNSMELLRHQKFSYQYILENIRKKFPTIPNLYNIILSYQITKTTSESQISYQTRWAFNKTSINDIEIHLFDTNDTGELNIAYDYKIDKYDEFDIINLNERLLLILEQFLHNKSMSIDDLKIITETEKNKILNDFNNTKKAYPSNKSIIELFEEQVSENPNSIALVFKDKKLTYSELDKKSTIIAQNLINNGTAPKDIIGIFLDKSLESIIAILAILKANCTYLPIDINYPKDRIDFMLEDSNVKFILSDKKYSSILNYDNKVLDIFQMINTNINSNRKLTPSKDNLAYIMYTSGSTGKPKGVMVYQKSIIRLIKNTNYIKFSKNDCILQTGSIVFDACTFEIWGALLNGLPLHIITKDDLLNVKIFSDYLINNKITILWLTAPLFNQLSEQQPNMFKNVKYLITGGDVLSPKHIYRVKSSNPDLTIINGYGPTENTTFSCCYKIDNYFKNSIPIGKPIANSTCYILSKNKQLQPIGVPGELYVGGDGVAAGYLNRNDLTKEKFIDNIFDDGIMYKTGDLAQWDNDGNIIFLGRIDNQVKIRGFRVELSEIDHIILNFKNISDCSTQIIELNNQKLICSYLVSNNKIDTNKLKDYLTKELPPYMIPTHFVEIDKLPLTINGKINKNQLPIPNCDSFTTNYIPPRNSIDSSLIKIISNILNFKKISINENFFNLGLDSLSAMTMTNYILENLNISITVKDIFENPTIESLSNFISNNKNKLKKISHSSSSSIIYSTSRAQKRIFYTSNMNQNLNVYNISGGIDFSIKLDFQKVCNIFQTLVDRHESFRTYFEIQNGELYQKISPSLILNIDCKNILSSNIDSEFEKFNTKFNLLKAPLLKIAVNYLENGHTLLFINIHHIISDGASMQILINEFACLYNNKPLPTLKFTYNDFINYEKYFLGSSQYEINKNFWLNEFSEEIPTLNLPTTYPRPSAFTYNGAKICYVLDENISNLIYETSKKLEVTPYMLLLSAYYILLYKYTGQNNIVVGTPTANRNTVEFSKIIGMFVNTIAIRKKIHSSTTQFSSFLAEVKEKCLNCFTHQNFPFEELVKNLNLVRDISRNPIFDTMFTYQNNTITKLDLSEIETKYYTPDTYISKFDLSIEVISQEKNFILNIEYCTDLFSKEFIQNMITHFVELIKNILINPNSKICDLDILPILEKNKLLYEFNNTKVNYNKNNFIYKAIDDQCLKTPNYTAITFKNEILSYKSLYDKTNSLANYLHKLGIGRNSYVGILLPRSIEMLIAMIAVLKTGACYIPIDPSFPKSRVEYMLNNSNASLLLTLTDNLDINKEKLNISLNNDNLYNNIELNFIPSTQSEDPAYLIYTSGSTGNPKGVEIPHRAITNLALSMNRDVEYLKNNYGNMSIASITTISFDIFVFETLISLQKGLNVIIATEEEQVTPIKINDLFARNKVKAFQTTPSKMEIIVNNQNIIPELKNIKYVTLVGEALTNNLKNKIVELGITLYNAYGPTETTVFSTYTNVSDYDVVTIGKPMANTQIFLLDKDNNICPIGIPGELCICGDGVGLGYKNISANQKNNYTISPISKKKMYRTGDLAKYLPNGELLYIGRIDNQIKLRGLRIELEEIENKILEFKNIKKTVIVLQKNAYNREYLVAYITVADTISINKLKEHLRKFLPKYMIPSYFEILDEFPYTPNGKVDKKLLPVPQILPQNQEFVEPRNDLDKKLLEIFEKLLNLSPIGIKDNFFELGGDSLLAINLQLEIMKVTEGISYADIFLNPTVQELTDKINNLNNIVESLSDTVNLLNCNTYIKTPVSTDQIIKKCKTDNILLLGATGFLGAHILNEFINTQKGNVYCLLRPEKGFSLKTKLLNKLHFYFNTNLDNLINKRIFILSGDIALPNLGLSDVDYNLIKQKISIIVNCAAKVSHFGKYELYKKINVDGVNNLIQFCKENKKTLYHTSTTSISGTNLNSNNLDELGVESNTFDESKFYINQELENVYVRSKFEAEKNIILEMKNGLDANIIRVGNLMGRYSDGHFQQNIEENAYINRIISFIRMKTIPQTFLPHTLEFTPIDYCAKAFVKLFTHTHNSHVFHLLDNNFILIEEVLNIFENNYYKINTLPDSEFKSFINSLIKNSNYSFLNGIISDFDSTGKLKYEKKIFVDSAQTNYYLSKLDFEWPVIDQNYITKFLKYLDTLYKF